MLILAVVYDGYTTNAGELTKEYLAQVLTIVIVGFLLWRVETLQELSLVAEAPREPVRKTVNIGEQLKKYCEATHLYLQHDLTLQQLATAIGTNRTYLGTYFTQQGITYNAYINNLRVEHFIRLYREAMAGSRPVTAQELGQQSGFSSYSTFSTAFKRFTGQSLATWMKGLETGRV